MWKRKKHISFIIFAKDNILSAVASSVSSKQMYSENGTGKSLTFLHDNL